MGVALTTILFIIMCGLVHWPGKFVATHIARQDAETFKVWLVAGISGNVTVSILLIAAAYCGASRNTIVGLTMLTMISGLMVTRLYVAGWTEKLAAK